MPVRFDNPAMHCRSRLTARSDPTSQPPSFTACLSHQQWKQRWSAAATPYPCHICCSSTLRCCCVADYSGALVLQLPLAQACHVACQLSPVRP